MKYFHVFVSSLSLLCATACAKTPDPICQELDAAIDSSIKRAALSLIRGEIGDKGAPQQTARYVEVNNHLQVIRISLDLLKQHECPIQKRVINPLIYDNSIDCTSEVTYRMIGSSKKSLDEIINLCGIKGWK
jgi:hypothetical protein